MPSGEAALVQLYAAGCALQWPALVPLARAYASLPGASETALRGTTRHLITFAGYAPCLKATLTLHKAGAYRFESESNATGVGASGGRAGGNGTVGGNAGGNGAVGVNGNDDGVGASASVPPGKTRGRPGDAFEAVYGPTTDRVRASMHSADPVVGEWMRVDLYGDVYSSPGISMRLKEIVACAFLAAADMPDQLLGHAVAALRFGATGDELREAAGIGCAWIGPGRSVDGTGTARAPPAPGSAPESPFRALAPVPVEALRVLALAEEKVRRGVAKGSMTVAAPALAYPDGEAYSVVSPPLPALFNVPGGRPAGESDPPVVGAPNGRGAEGGRGAFAWEVLSGKNKDT